MEQYKLENIRNVCLLSHGGTGKTSLSEAALFTAGVTNRLGKVDEGNTVSDYDADEIKRKISINLSVLPLPWRDTKINLLDTPGYADFVAEVKAAVRVTEAAVIVFCAASGVEVGHGQVWQYSQEAGLPRFIFVNRMDRENADFARVVADIQARFGPKCLPVQVPIGAHTTFQGVIDLLTWKSYTGSPAKESETPEPLKAQAAPMRDKLVEAIAEVDDKLIEKYLGGEELTLDELRKALKLAIAKGTIFPILAGSALQNVAVNRLLDTILEYAPSPKEREYAVLNDSTEQKIAPSQDGPLAALVFKTTADPYVGKLTYFRVFSGAISSNSQVWNGTHSGAERIGQLFMMRGKTQEPVPQVGAGDIGAVAKLSVTATGDTLCRQDKPVKLPPVHFPEPIFSLAVYPKTKADLDKLGAALARVTEEDPTLRMRREPSTNETVLYGLGETQLGVAADRMHRKFGVGVELKIPKVPYRETITIPAGAEYKHKKQTGGHGQYGHVVLQMEPLPRGEGNKFEEKVVGGSVPRNYIPAVEKGVHDAVQEGVIAGFPVVDVRVTLVDGSYHPVDSSEICFKIAGAGAVKKGMSQAQPILLEPIVNLKVTVPNDLTGDIIGDLNTKRARVHGMNPDGDWNVIEAEVPLAEVQRYAIDLKSMTQGRGTYHMEFDHYEQVPAHVTQKIVAERQAEKEAEKEKD